MIDVQTYPVAHDKNGGGGGGKTYMFGGQSNVPSNLYVNSINASLGNIKHLTTTSLSSNDANFIYVTANDGNIYKLQGNDLDFYNGHIANLAVDCISADSLDLKNLSALKATIEELIAGDITTKNLTVTGTAHFFELIIDKIRSVGGQLILTPTSCIVDYVQYYNNGTLITNPEQYSTANSYDIYWRGSDPYGRAVNNEWIENDQAICQSFNNAAVGTNNNVTNKYYWMLVNNKLDDLYVNLKTGETTSQQNQTTYNTIYVGMWDTTWTENNNTHANQIEWNCAVQTIDGVPVSDVNWDDTQLPSGFAVMGTMQTSDKLFGLKITPTGDNKNRMTDKLKFTFEQETASAIIPAPQMNITVTFTDDTFMYFPNVQAKQTEQDGKIVYVKENGHYVFELDLSAANNPISIITVVCAQDVDWHLCHGIRLNGTVKAENCAGYPEAGDNLIQLGWHSEAGQTLTDDQKKRQAAIIISAYNSPDPALQAPSYAHYQGINDFKLETHRGSYFDANGARFTGDITFSNIGDLTATDKWMKLNYTSAPIISTMNEDGTRTTAPSTFGLSITSIDDREFVENSTTHEMENNPNFKKTVTYNVIPDGYSIFIYYYDKNGILNYNVPSIYSGDANYGDLSSIAAPNAVEVQGNTKLVMKIVCKLVKGLNPNANVIDEIEIIYDEKDYWKTDSWCLIPEKEVAYATILDRFNQSGGTETANTQDVKLYVDLQYAAGHYKQGEISNVEFGASSGLFLRARVYYQPLADSPSGPVLSEFQTNNITWSYTNDNIHGSFQADNYLTTLWPHNTNYRDYMQNYTNNRDRNPVMFEIELVDGRGSTDVVLDTRTVYVSLQSGAVMKIMQNAIVSAVSASKSYTDTTAAGLQTQINNNTSLITQTATNITNWVTSNYVNNSTLGTTVENLESTIDQTAGQIRTEVKRTYGKSADRLVSGASGVITNTIDMTDTNTYREDRYYEVHITPVTTHYTDKHEYIFQIARELQSNTSYWGHPTYGYHGASTDDPPYGFELMYNFSAITDSNGQCNPLSIYVNEYYLNYVSTGIAVGRPSYVQNNGYLNYIYLYLRGGSRYELLTNQSVNVTKMPYEYIGSAPTEPVEDKPSMSSIEQTATSISMYVVEEYGTGVTEEDLKRTGIDITSGNVVINADQTTINGNLKLTDTANGLTMYDSNGVARVNIQPRAISDIMPTNNDLIFNLYGNLTYSANSPFWTGISNGISLENNSVVQFNPRLLFMMSNGTTPSSYSIYGEVILYNNNNFTQTKTVTWNKDTRTGYNGYYQLNDEISFAISNQSYTRTYYVRININSFSYSSDASRQFNTASLSCQAFSGADIQTYMGTDGFYSHTGMSRLFKVDKNNITMQTGRAGLRFTPSEDFTLGGKIETICAMTGSSGSSYVPTWISAYNYVPMIQLGTGTNPYLFTQQYIYVPSYQYKYAWKMDVTRDYGDILVMAPAMDSNFNNQESWIVLPPYQWTDSAGNTCVLPVGYKVTVWNGFSGSDDIYITPYRASSSTTAKIMDSNRNTNDYIRMDTGIEQCNDIFVYVGYWGGTYYWLAMHDVQ